MSLGDFEILQKLGMTFLFQSQSSFLFNNLTYKIGTGAYSSVYKVKRLTDGQIYAMKKVDINDLTFKEK